MLDVHLPRTDGREIVMSRYTQPEKDPCLPLDQMNLTLPEQAPPKMWMLGKELGSHARKLINAFGTIKSMDVVVPVRRGDVE